MLDISIKEHEEAYRDRSRNLGKREEKLLELQLYDYPYYDIAIKDLQEQVQQLKDDYISDSGKSFIELEGRSNDPSDRTGNSASQIADIEELPQAQHLFKSIEKYRRFKASTERIVDNLSNEDREFVELFYFERLKTEDLCNLLAISERNMYHRKKAVLKRIAMLKGWL